VTEILEEARRRGFLGPGPVQDHIDHAAGMAAAIGPPPGPFLDLGTGSGIPGLVLALAWPESTGVLLDGKVRRTGVLARALTDLGLADRIQVLTARAEAAAHDPAHRAHYALVVARGFGPPAATAECASALLHVGGRLAVSEPPDSDPTTRWPEAGIAELGLTPPELRRSEGVTVALLTLTHPPRLHIPRGANHPTKRPLW